MAAGRFASAAGQARCPSQCVIMPEMFLLSSHTSQTMRPKHLHSKHPSLPLPSSILSALTTPPPTLCVLRGAYHVLYLYFSFLGSPAILLLPLLSLISRDRDNLSLPCLTDNIPHPSSISLHYSTSLEMQVVSQLC